MLFENLSFLILPNVNASSTQFRCKLIKENGGTIIHTIDEINNNQIVVLIVDSFLNIRKDGIKDIVLFTKEISFDLDIVFNKINEYQLYCFELSRVSRWLSESIVPTDDIGQRIHFKQNMVTVNDADDDDDGTSNGIKQTDLSLLCEPKKEMNNNDKKINFEGELIMDERSSLSKSTIIKRNLEGQKKVGSKNSVELTSILTTPDNTEIIRALEYLVKKHKTEGNNFKSRNYEVAKKVIEKCNFKIVSGKQAERRLPHIGNRIGKLIQRVINTGRLPGEEIETNQEQALIYFQNCHGVGPSTAKKWAMLKMTSFKDVLIKLPEDFITGWPLLFGWKYYEDWSIQISRQETELHFKKIKEYLFKIDEKCHVEIQGSYNRGKESSGDIDLLFYREDCNNIEVIVSILQELIIQLHREGYIKCILQLQPQIYDEFEADLQKVFKTANLKLPGKDNMISKKLVQTFYLGGKLNKSVFNLTTKEREIILQKSSRYKLKNVDSFMSGSAKTDANNYCRRLDFFTCKWSELGAARLQWTGSAEFNRWIRLEAIKKGYRLTQHGLFQGENLVESFDEKRIFKLLDIPYVAYEQREQGLWEKRSDSNDK